MHKNYFCRLFVLGFARRMRGFVGLSAGYIRSFHFCAGWRNKMPLTPICSSELPNLREQQERGRQMLGHLGGKVQSIEEEARHRKKLAG